MSEPPRSSKPAVPSAQVTWDDRRLSGSTEASSLGWPPGEVPRSFDVVADGLVPEPFSFKENVRHGGEVVGWRYAGSSGSPEIVVFND